jgi:alpha-tubulin suppressor-like RCC1 family protein
MLATASVVLLAAIGCSDDDNAPTGPAGTTPSSAPLAAATALAFWQMSGGLFHTCAVTTDFVPYCWGWNPVGQLGIGTVTGPDSCPNSQPCSTKPVAVLGGHRFRQVSAGDYHSCGVTPDFHAWCWGNGEKGDLGNGATQQATAPVAVAGGLLFRQVATGFDFTCGVSYPDNRAYCWGYNNLGQLGDGTLTNRLKPVPVLGGLRLRQISAGGRHVCAVTTDDRAFCWGRNDVGQLGDSTNVGKRTRPVAVAGGHRFRYIAAGAQHTCAVTTSDRAFCWGGGRQGQLGNGKTYLSFWPRAVSGGLSIRRIGAGVVHTCAETTDSRAYCWGGNDLGQLGNGSALSQALTPVAVAGGLHFAQLGVGRWHTCGKTSSSVGYCWGDDLYGQLGNGTSGSHSTTPVPVVGAM